MLLVCGWLAGCGAIDRRVNEGYAAAPLDLSTDHSATLRTMIKAQVQGVDACFANSTTLEATACASKRNQVISMLMTESVYLCTEHLNSIYGREAAFNIATGSIAALSSGFAAVATAGRASTLSALSAFATAERSLVNETVYKSMLTTAIGTKISQLREQKGGALLKRKAETIESYGLEEAIQEALMFHDSCSFRVGLQVALAEGTQTTSESKRGQLEAKALQLMNQINAYATMKQFQPTSYALDANGTTKSITDPFLKSFVDQYLAVSRAIQDLLPESGSKAPGATTTTGTSVGSGAATPTPAPQQPIAPQPTPQ